MNSAGEQGDPPAACSHDVTSTMVAVAVLGAAVFCASVFPARRAARVEPTDALRWTE